MRKKYFTEEERKEAQAEGRRRRYAENPEKILKHNRKYREENREKAREQSKRATKLWAQKHPEEYKASKKKWRDENPEKVRAKSKKSEQKRKTDPIQRAKRQKRQKEYYSRPEVKARINKKNKEKRKDPEYTKKKNDAAKRWRQNNPDKQKAIQKRGFQKQKSNPDYKTNQRFYGMLQYANKIRRTPKHANKRKMRVWYKECLDGYEVDHIIPMQGKNVSGLNIETNFQYLTIRENRIKNNHFDFEEYKLTKHYKNWIIKINENLAKIIANGGNLL